MSSGIRAAAYLRISRDEAQKGESSSISNQRQIIRDYCAREGITLVREYADDGWSGGNFDRPQFQAMLGELEGLGVQMVITKDLSRLGRDMVEAGYYAEKYFPDRRIRFITVSDRFDSDDPATMTPFMLAMNDVYLRDGSRKVRQTLKNKRENGLYCAAAPYGYRKAEGDVNHLVPDEETGPVVQRIFRMAAEGLSARAIALTLTAEGIPTPSQQRSRRYRYADETPVSPTWSMTTVKRILHREVYLGHTVLGRERKVSVKTKKKVPVDRERWAITEHTHPALVTPELFQAAQQQMGKGRQAISDGAPVRSSIFRGIAYCALCGHALCSSGTTYKGERERYWTLSCTHQRRDIPNPCPGVRVSYHGLVEVVRRELNSLISLSEDEVSALVSELVNSDEYHRQRIQRQQTLREVEQKMASLQAAMSKSYEDSITGVLSATLFASMQEKWNRQFDALEQEKQTLQASLHSAADPQENYDKFFALVQGYTHIETLDREAVETFIERIEVGPKILPEGRVRATHRGQAYRQSIKIYYRFIGSLESGEAEQDEREG